MGRMTRNGGMHEASNEGTLETLAGIKVAGQWRTAEANKPQGKAPHMFDTDLPINLLMQIRFSNTLLGTMVSRRGSISAQPKTCHPPVTI
jgi:hypothetical protein